MRHVRRLAVAFSFAAACTAAMGCSPDRQSGANKRVKAAASKSPSAAATPQPASTPATTSTSYSQPTPEAAAAISGLEMPDAKSMLITNEAMTSSLSAPVTESVAPAGQTIPQAPLVPSLSK